MVRTQQPRDLGWSVVVGLFSTITASMPKRSSSNPIASPTGPPPTMNTDVRPSDVPLSMRSPLPCCAGLSASGSYLTRICLI
jgi:hypothetical protein